MLQKNKVNHLDEIFPSSGETALFVNKSVASLNQDDCTKHVCYCIVQSINLIYRTWSTVSARTCNNTRQQLSKTILRTMLPGSQRAHHQHKVTATFLGSGIYYKLLNWLLCASQHNIYSAKQRLDTVFRRGNANGANRVCTMAHNIKNYIVHMCDVPAEHMRCVNEYYICYCLFFINGMDCIYIGQSLL